MEFFTKKLSVLNDKQIKLSNLPIKKSIMTAITASALVFGLANAEVHAAGSKLTTVYYVYMNDTYLGTVSHKNVVEEMIEDKIEAMEDTYKTVDLTMDGELTYIPEQVFRSTANNAETIENVVEQLDLQAKSSAIVIGGNPVVHLESKAAAEEVIKKLKLKYVTEAQLNDLEARKAVPTVTLPVLKENETRILDIHLSKEISFEDANVLPDKIMAPDQALAFLQKGTLEDKKYTVKDGDVLGSIASNANLSTAQLISLNPGMKEDSLLKIGQELNITVPMPYIEVVLEKEVFQKEVISFTKSTVKNDSMFKGEKKVKQEGKNGQRAVTYVISEQNGSVLKKEIVKQEILQQPINEVVELGTKVVPSRGDGSFAWPATGGYISSQVGYRWGKMHKGIDIARPSSKTIKAADNGVVVSAGWDGGYGNKIVIDHQNGLRTVYAHLSSIDVSSGQTVAKGSKIGNMGSTGDSTGVHLHFEVYKGGSLQNPLNYIKK